MLEEEDLFKIGDVVKTRKGKGAIGTIVQLPSMVKYDEIGYIASKDGCVVQLHSTGKEL